MASNKNQHFVPRCYLRPFSADSQGKAINLYNLDRRKIIEGAPLKHQCSGDYFYGRDPLLEAAIQRMEVAYSGVLRELLEPRCPVSEEHRVKLKLFWLLQHMRTEAASVRAVQMGHASLDVMGIDEPHFRLGIREAVQMAMKTFAESMDAVDDLKAVLLRNRTSKPFITSDDPAVLTNRWHAESRKCQARSYGVLSAGALLLLPLSPRVLFLGYDGDVYSVPHHGGWADVERVADVEALNQHQFLNCRANVFVHDASHSEFVRESFLRAAPHRPQTRHAIHYAVLDGRDGNHARYRVTNPEQADPQAEGMVHMQVIHPRPSAWPRQFALRPKGFVYTNGTGAGYVRRAHADSSSRIAFRREPT